MTTDPEDRSVATQRKIMIDPPKFLPQEFLERPVALMGSRALLYRPNDNNKQRGKLPTSFVIITLGVLFVTSLVVGSFLNEFESKQIKFDSCSQEYMHLELKYNQLRVSVRKLVQKVERNEEIMKSFLTHRNKAIEHFINNSIKTIMESVDKTIEIYDADTIGLIDYALESNGGQVISTPATTPYSPFNIEGLLGFLHTYTLPSNPQTLLQPSHFPGDCFAFAGSHGRIRIQLATSVAITAVTVEHVDRRLVLDRSSAPKHFEILGLDSNDSDEGEKLGEFEYNLDRKRVQTFEVLGSSDWNKAYGLLELRVLTNYGNPEFTCIYRFRVHGKPV